MTFECHESACHTHQASSGSRRLATLPCNRHPNPGPIAGQSPRLPARAGFPPCDAARPRPHCQYRFFLNGCLPATHRRRSRNPTRPPCRQPLHTLSHRGRRSRGNRRPPCISIKENAVETKLTTLCSALVLLDVRRTDHFIVAVDRQLSFAEQRLRQSQLSRCALTKSRPSAVIRFRRRVWESLLIPFRTAAWCPRSPQDLPEAHADIATQGVNHARPLH